MGVSALPIKQDIFPVRGDTHEWAVYVEDNLGTEEEPVWEPRDWTGYTILSQIREDKNRGALVATYEVDSATPGWLFGFLPIDESENLPGETTPGVKPVLYWDVEYTWTEGSVTRRKTHYAGKAKVMGDVSDA